MPDRDLSAEALQLLLGEDLCDEPELAEDGQAPAVGDGDPGRLLPSVLEGVQSEVRDARDVAARRVDSEDAAHG